MALGVLGLGLLALLAVWLSLGLVFGYGRSQRKVSLFETNKGVVATGTLPVIAADASAITGFPVSIPGYLPPKGYIDTITASTGAPEAFISIHVPPGHYTLTEMEGPFHGLKGLKEVPSLETPGKTVYLVSGSPTGAEYYIPGKQENFLLQAESDSTVASAKVDFPKIIESLP